MKKNKKRALGLLVALLLISGAGVYTYARYTTSFTGTGTVDVAKWAVELKQGDAAVSENFVLDLTLAENSNVAEGKMAPGRSATAQLVLNLEGTEVATDYEIDLSQVSGLPTGMTISEVKETVGTGTATPLTGSNGKYTGDLTLTEVTDSKTVTFDITVAWENADENDANDTATGTANANISIPVTVTAKQHIG